MCFLIMAWNTHKGPRLWGQKLLYKSRLLCAVASQGLQDGIVNYVAVGVGIGPRALNRRTSTTESIGSSRNANTLHRLHQYQ